jgi:hypothetical protein
LINLILLQLSMVLQHMVLKLNVSLDLTDVPLRITLRFLLVLVDLPLEIVLNALLEST